jgi:hypothetical protein
MIEFLVPGAHRPPAKAHTRGGQYQFELLSRRLRTTPSAELGRTKDGTVEARLLNRPNEPIRASEGCSSENIRTLLGFFCKIFSFAKFPFGLQPELHIPPRRSVVFFPDFLGAREFSLRWASPERGLAVSILHQSQDNLHGFPITNPPREITVLVGLLYEAGDEMLLIHRAPL